MVFRDNATRSVDSFNERNQKYQKPGRRKTSGNKTSIFTETKIIETNVLTLRAVRREINVMKSISNTIEIINVYYANIGNHVEIRLGPSSVEVRMR